MGALLLFWSFYPILSFEIYSRLFIQNNVQTPVPRNQTVSALGEATAVLGSYSAFNNNLRDFTHAQLWFPTTQQDTTHRQLQVKEYSLSIPKLNIKDAMVTVGVDDLTKSLIQYLPDSVPGEYGNSVIFGHSTLPALYNVKDYKTIFTYLPKLEKGDKIIVSVNGTKYEYSVYDMFVVKPEQVSVLEQRKDGSFITLITCVPPGTFWNRLVVRAKLADLTAKL
jgi:sortase A